MDSVTSARARKPRFRRPHFREGQLLTADALNAQQADSIDRLRLLARAMFGRGVVFGYALDREDKGYLKVSCGLALDRYGREVFWPGGVVGLTDLISLPPKPGRYTLSVHYAEHHSGRELPSYCEKDEIDWIEQSAAFSVTSCCEKSDCCTCPEPEDDECFDLCDFVCARTGSVTGSIAAAPDLDDACKKATGLCPISGKAGWRYDPEAGIALGCIEVCVNSSKSSECEPELIFCETPIETCHHRPFAYRNPLLFELIKGCHLGLARVQNLSWNDWFERGWNGKVTWPEFQNRLTGGDDLVIEFSRQIRIDTLNPASIRLTARTQEWKADYWETDGIPFKIEFPEENDGSASQAKLVLDPDWIQAEVSGGRSSLFHGALIELTIRGALIRDDCGRVLDVRPLDISDDTCAPAMPGGDFVAFFRLAQRPEHGEDQSAAPQSSHTSASA